MISSVTTVAIKITNSVKIRTFSRSSVELKNKPVLKEKRKSERSGRVYG